MHTDYINNILKPTNGMYGDDVPVSAFVETANGMVPSGTAAFEKRGIALDIPQWDPNKCMQCNWCSYVCPHAVVRPFIMTAEEAEGYDGLKVAYKGDPDKFFAIGVSALDCTGCGSCAEVCPARKKAIEMAATDTDFMEKEQAKFEQEKIKSIKSI